MNIEEENGEPDLNISSGISNSKKLSYDTGYRAMREELVPGNFVEHLGNIISRSEALVRSPMNIFPADMEERILKPRDQLEMFQYYMQSPHSMGQIQQDRIYSHVYENRLPSTPLPTKSYQLPVLADQYLKFPNIFPGIKLHDGYMGISSQPFSYRIGSQGDAGSTHQPPASSSSQLVDHGARCSIFDEAAGASSTTKLNPYRPSAVSYSPPSQMLGDASVHMGSSSDQHTSVPPPLQNSVPAGTWACLSLLSTICH